MADLSSKQLQDFLDSQSEMLSDLFSRLEGTQTRQNKQINDAIDRLSQVLGQKFDRLQNLAAASANNSGANNADLSKVSASIDRLSVKTEAMGKEISRSQVQTSEGIGKIFDTVLKVISVGTEAMKASYQAVNQQINFNRQMEVNGVVSTFKELENAAKNSGVSLDQLSDAAGTFKNVVISLNASGMRGVEALADMSRHVFDQLQKQNISFTQEESLSLTGAVSESLRRSGRLHELSQAQIEQQTIQMGRLIAAVTEQTGASRSEVMKGLAEGPSPILREGLRQRGWSAEQSTALEAVYTALEHQWGAERVNSWREYSATGGTPTDSFVKNNPLVYSQIGSSIRQLEEMVRSGANENEIIDMFNRRIVENDSSLPSIPQVAALNDPFIANISRNRAASLSTSEMIGQRVGRATGDQEFARERVETNELFKANAQAARDMNDASNNLRHLMMRMTHSVSMYKEISDIVYGNFKMVGEGADELAGELANAIEELTGKKASYKNGELSLIGSAEAAEIPGAMQGATIGKTIGANIAETGGMSLVDPNADPKTIENTNAFIESLKNSNSFPQSSAHASPMGRVFHGEANTQDYLDSIGATGDAIYATSLAASAATGASVGSLWPGINAGIGGLQAYGSYKKAKEAFAEGDDRAGYAHKTDMWTKIGGSLLIAAGIITSWVGGAGVPLIVAGSGLLAADNVTEAVTGQSASQHISNAVYDANHPTISYDNQKISDAIRKMNIDTGYDLNPAYSTAGYSGNPSQDMAEFARIMQRTADATESINRKMDNGANIYGQ